MKIGILIGASVLLSLVTIISPIYATEINKDWLRHDETLGLDEIALEFSDSCVPLPDVRTLGLGVDRIQFRDTDQRLLLSIDVGSSEGSYYLGEGWHGNETWGAITACWANAKANRSTIYCRVPAGSKYLELVCVTPPCADITTEVLLNGQKLGAFSLPANTGFNTFSLTLPNEWGPYLEYRLREGGPLQISHVEWINSEGIVIATTPTTCELVIGDSVMFPIQIPPDVGDFDVKLSHPAIAVSILQVSINNASSVLIEILAGIDHADTTEEDALQRQADRKTQSSGWGEDFNARNSFVAQIYPGSDYPQLVYNGDDVGLSMPSNSEVMYVNLTLPESLAILQYPYLSLRVKVTKGDLYFIRPKGYDANGNAVPLWYAEAVTDNRRGTGQWEILTINLQRLAKLAGTRGISISEISFPLIDETGDGATIELDWIRIHDGLLPNPEDIQSQETLFANHLDDDADGLVDRDDEDDFRMADFSRPLILAYYHPWFGSPYSDTGWWSGWSGEQRDYSDTENPSLPLGVIYNPDTFDPEYQGKRNLSSPYYPLNFWDYPNYVPPSGDGYRYDIYGGVEQHDNLSQEYLRKEIALALEYGIDGFVADSGGRGSYEAQIKETLSAALEQEQHFWLTVLYDWYYRLPAYLMEEKPDYSMALDLLFFYEVYGDHPQWLRFDDRPVITAPYLSHTVDVEKWLRVEEIFLNPESSSFNGIVDPSERMPGFGNIVEFQFARAEQPGVDQRYLSIVFDTIRCLGKDLQPISTLDIGTPEARAHLLYGWSGDEIWAGGQTMVWAEGTERHAALEIEIPVEATFLEISCSSYPLENMVSMKINGGRSVDFSVPKRLTTFIFRLAGSGTESPNVTGEAEERPFALFLDSREAAQHFDGFASYGPSLGTNRIIVSDPAPTILTVGCGYDDRKIRFPGNFTDRENGMLYRRQWEKALAGEPDVVLINTWNEWAEGTNIAPTVEFGYKYLELTLTYSLIFHGKISASAQPSELDLTVHRYEMDEQGAYYIECSAERQGIVSFHGIPMSTEWLISRDGQPYETYTVNAQDQTLDLHLGDGRSIYSIRDKSFNYHPEVTLLTPEPDNELSGDALITWQAIDRDGDELTVSLLYSTDGTRYWLLADMLPNTGSYTWNTTQVFDSPSCQLQIVVSDGKAEATDLSEGTFSINNNRFSWDIDGNGIVDISDLILVGDAIGTLGEELPVDMNGDGVIDILDLVIVAMHYGETVTPGVAAAPQALASLHTEALEHWLRLARIANDGSETFRRGITVLEYLSINIVPEQTALLQNYPNPFNPDTWIPYDLSEASEVSITIYDITGRIIRSLDLGYKSAGIYRTQSTAVHWNGRNETGEPVASGLYFILLKAGEHHQMRRIVLAK